MQIKLSWKKILQYVIFLAVAVLFLWLAGKDISLEEMMVHVRKAHLWPLILVFIVGIGSHYIRALRWKMLIEPLGYKVNVTNTFLSIMVGYLVNLGTPRMGEVARCAVLSRYEKIPADKLAGTMLVERAFDFLSLIGVLLLTYVVEYKAVNEFLNEIIFTPLLAFATGTNLLIIGGVLVVIILLFIYVRKKINRMENKISAILKNIFSGIGSVKKMKNPGLFLLHTCIIWAMYLFMTYLGFLAFDSLSHLPFGTALSTLSIGSFGFVIPTPQGAGSFQAFVMSALHDMYGIEKGLAFAYANVSWIAQTLVLISGGFIALISLPIYNRKRNGTDEK